jgi:hypothetical protein
MLLLMARKMALLCTFHANQHSGDVHLIVLACSGRLECLTFDNHVSRCRRMRSSSFVRCTFTDP